MNTIPLVKGNTQEEINTSLIALKKVLDEMNSSSGKTDASVQSQIKHINELITNINSHLDTIDGQITDLQPVDSVTSGNMQSVTSNAVADYTKGVKVTTIKGTTEPNGYLTFSLPQGSIGIVLNGVVTNLNSVVVEFSRYMTTLFIIPKEINGSLLPNTYVEIDIAYI